MAYFFAYWELAKLLVELKQVIVKIVRLSVSIEIADVFNPETLKVDVLKRASFECSGWVLANLDCALGDALFDAPQSDMKNKM